MAHSNLPFLVTGVALLLSPLVVFAPGCSHLSSTGTNGGAGTGNNGTGSGGTGGNNGTGSGGTGGNGGNGSNGGSGGTAGFFDGGAVDTDGAPPMQMQVACTDTAYSDAFTPGYQEDSSIPGKVQTLVNSFSVTDLANQMRGTSPQNNMNFSDIFRTPDDSTHGVRGFKFRDGPRGVVLAAQLPSGANGYSTAFPVPELRAATFDLALEEQVGEAIGDELIGSGNTMLLAPVINILRHPAWGRAQETYGEDSFVLGRMGSAFTTGVQVYGPACAKHYMANNVEDGRATNNANMDEQTLREMYARHFGVVIQDAGVSCVMASYNLVNGTNSTLNTHILTDVLRTDFGFKGLVLSDWWAMPPGQASASTAALQANAVAGVNAGLDMELPWSYNYGQLEAAVSANALTQSQLKTSASRILEQKFRFKVEDLSTQQIGLKSPTTSLDSSDSIQNNTAHVALAQQVALEGMVLLKNDSNTLPIPSTVKTVAVIGAGVPFNVQETLPTSGTINFATDVRLGDLGSSRVFADPAKSSGPFAGIQAQAPSGVTVVNGNSASAAANADFIVAVAGLTPQDEGEEYTGAGDRTNFDLDGKTASSQPGPQNTLINSLIALNKPMVVVLEGGSVINMPWLSSVKAVVMAFYPGQQGGNALGQLLFGKANFGGKLPFTWPNQWSDEPPFGSGTLTDDYHVGYAWFDNKNTTPLYAFGHGLSYTTFKYANLFVPCSTVTSNGVVNVTTDITNTGTVAGDETAFLFVSFPGSTVRHPAKMVKGFYRVSLMPGETKRITFPVRVSDLKYWDMSSSGWVHPTGQVQVQVGPSADNLPLMGTFTLQ
jgi:beta-glucosidase